MQITILDHNFSYIDFPNISLPPLDYKALYDLLYYEQKTFNRRTKRFKIDYCSHINFDNNTFYTGLVPFIQDNIPNTQIIDRRIFPDVEFKVPALTKEPRPYQIEFLLKALAEKRMVVHSETGSGKTLMMAAILDSLDLDTLILASGKGMMVQLKKELEALMPHRKFGLASGEGIIDWNQKQVIGLAGTLVGMPAEDLRHFKCVLVDECHGVPASQPERIVLATGAPYRFGFTATPTGRSDNRDLTIQGLIGPICKLTDRDDLVAQGYLAQTVVEMRRAAWDGDYTTLEDLLIVKNPKRNNLILKIVKENHGSTILILVKRIEHGKILKELIKDSIFISGKSLNEEREEVREKIKRSDFKVLIASNIMSQGTDIPNLEVGINARGGKAEIGTAQGVGRVVRPWQGLCKKWIDIFDDYQGTLEDHSLERMRIYSEENLPVVFVDFPPGKEKKLAELAKEIRSGK